MASNPVKSINQPDAPMKEGRRSSVIEHEYMFNAIPQNRPSSRPIPTAKVSSGTTTTRAEVGDIEVSRYDLYKEAVYTCAHYLGVPSPQRFPAGQEEMCLYAHEVFSESQKEQEAVMEHVRNEPHPLTIVNTKVKKAKGLQGPKLNGFVDPYCIVTIETSTSSVVFQLGRNEWQSLSTESPVARQNHLKTKHLRPPAEARTSQIYDTVPDYIKTSVQKYQKDPTWDQRFQCLSLRPSADKLTVEVWDQAIDYKNVAKAIRNTNDASKISIQPGDSERKKADVFLGKVTVKVSDIPCDGSDRWYPLNGTPHTKDKQPKGKIRLQIWLVHAYRHGRHFTEVAEPKIILRRLWEYILNAEKARYSGKNKWDGSIPSAATCLLFQYALQNGISEDTHAVIRWNAYSKQNLELPGLIGLKDVMEKAKKDDEGKLPPRIADSQQEVEDSVMGILRDKVLPIIRNHLRESYDRVHEALHSYQHCVDIVTKYNNTELLQMLLWLVHSAMRMAVLEWYQRVYADCVPSQGQIEKDQYVIVLVQVMKEVNSLLRLGEVKWSPEFWLTAKIEYLPIIYDELQKMVVHDVEAICWLFFQFYLDNRKLRKILLLNEENDKNFCSGFFDLYKQTQVFVFAQANIFKDGSSYEFLENYHRWFRPILVLWLGFALIRGSLMIYKTIHIDNHVQDNQHTMTSSSALDTATVFTQLVRFWSTLNWPDISEGYVIINFLMEVICSYTVLYAELKHEKLNKEGYYDPSGRFTISERLCTALNNIEHVKEQVQLVPKEIDIENLTQLLEKACGKSAHVIMYEERTQERLEKTVMIVNKHIDDILDNVSRRLQKEISAFIKESFFALSEISNSRLNDAMEPTIAYLEDNIVVLQKSLLPQNFHKVLQLLWNLVCVGLHDNAVSWEVNSTEDQITFFQRVMNVIPHLQEYFEGGEAGLKMEEMNTDQYLDMYDLFSYFTMSTEELIVMYYQTRAKIHLEFKGKAKLGTLRVKMGYWNNKLSVEVISASNLTPHDEELTFLKYFHRMHPTSDPMVELELRPSYLFANEKKYVTQVRWKNLNPVFEESFYWSISAEDCANLSAVIVFTVKDYDLLSKNAFLGEAMVPLHVIPGVSPSPEPQPMNLKLHEVDKEDHMLLILQSRKWDARAKQFSDEEFGKYVEPVVTKK